jgi:hypothetical protein
LNNTHASPEAVADADVDAMRMPLAFSPADEKSKCLLLLDEWMATKTLNQDANDFHGGIVLKNSMMQNLPGNAGRSLQSRQSIRSTIKVASAKISPGLGKTLKSASPTGAQPSRTLHWLTARLGTVNAIQARIHINS